MATVTTKTFIRTHVTDFRDCELSDAECFLEDIKTEVDKIGGDEWDMINLKTGEVIMREDLVTAIKVLQAFQRSDTGITNNEWVLE